MKIFLNKIKCFLQSNVSILFNATIIAAIIGVVGSYVIQNAQENFENKKDAYERKRSAFMALRETTKGIDMLRIRATMLHSSLNRYTRFKDADAQYQSLIKQRKKMYDQAYIKWHENKLSNGLKIREVFRYNHETFYEKIIEQQINFLFQKYDTFLTGYYDKVITGASYRVKSLPEMWKWDNPKQKLGIQRISNIAKQCLSEVVNKTYNLIANEVNCSDPIWYEQSKIIYNYMNDVGCSVNKKPSDLLLMNNSGDALKSCNTR